MPVSENLTLSACLPPDPRVREFIQEQIRAFNNAHSPAHRESRKSGLRPLDFVLRDAAGRLCGGLLADTYWGWVEILDLWIEETYRGRGYGAALLAAGESAARDRGCSRALLCTFSFQARGFYEKHGYRVVGELENYPPGESFYWMRKEIGRPGPVTSKARADDR